jgi:pyruvate dehydrogenase E2 component (dihydrolipoamide acetyltransferase)
MSQLIEVKIPDIGDFKDVPVIEVLVRPGDAVKAEDALLTLESDKATMDVPSPAAGIVKELKVKVGDRVSEGTLVLTLEPAEEAAPARAEEPALEAAGRAAEAGAAAKAAQRPAPAAHPAPAPTEAAPAPAAPPAGGAQEAPAGTFAVPHASPSVRRFARELGVDLARVRGSGPKGRILREDVQGFVKSELARAAAPAGGAAFGLPPPPQVDFAKFGPVRTEPLARIRRLSGANLHRNWLSIPHVTQHDEADITELEDFRKRQAEEAQKQGVRLTLVAFLLKASVVALRQFPQFNASLAPDGESLVFRQYYHIGVAVDTPNGLVVPVIRDCDKKGLLELARELGEVSERMRAGAIRPADLQGGCFSISSLGGIGGSYFTPIVNAPEVAILGVGRATMRPQWNGREFVPRLMLPLSLSYDHRVIDGAQGARFVSYLASVLSDIRRLAL